MRHVPSTDALKPPPLKRFEALGSPGCLLATFLAQSHLPSNVLQRIWLLADMDQDGYLTLAEYAVAMHLVAMKMDGEDLPETLPEEMRPCVA